MSQKSVAAAFLKDAIDNFGRLKALGDGALEQLSDEEFSHKIDNNSNSIAIICKHLGGNMISRWTDFLNSDGEKSDRNRPTEFIADSDTRESIMARLDSGWQTLFATLKSLKETDVLAIVKIRDESHTVLEAINRQLIHYGVHIGQIMLLAKHFKSDRWQSVDQRWGRRMPEDYR